MPIGFREEETLRNLQAAQFNHRKALDNIERQVEWRQANLPIKITNTVEQLIVRTCVIKTIVFWIHLHSWQRSKLSSIDHY